MTDKELLLSISNIMDNKLQPIENRIDALEQNLKADIQRLDSKIDTVEQKIKTVEHNLEAVTQNLEAKIHLIDMKLDNMIVPRLNEIESCYLSTYERYSRETDKLVGIENDMSVMKDVVIEHGNKLKALGA